MISVLILTKNESLNIADCIQSCSWSDDIVVFDSFSTDQTVAIAQSLNARVVQHPFKNYGAQREAARKIQYNNRWVLAIDADERPEPELVDELQRIALKEKPEFVAYRLRRKDYFMGKWIKYSTLYPSWFVRFYQPDKVHYEPRSVHEYPEVHGEMGALNGHLLHYSFSKGIDEWFVKHCKYAALEASENVRSLSSSKRILRLSDAFSFDPVKRRRTLKAISIYAPVRPLLRFLYSFIFRLGFLDGIAGYRYAKMLAIYESMIVLNVQDQLSQFKQRL